ncbi:MAG: hypothetical protein NVSMB39_4760 [Candidatus Saccharimonadales bacterium]
MSKKLIWSIAAIGVASLMIAAIVFIDAPKPPRTVKIADVVSQQGIHWHPVLSIYIKGVKQDVPANIGFGNQYSKSKWYDPMMNMTDFHTHDNSGTLHWEVMEGPVTKDHVKLGTFFSVWGK